MRTKGKEFLFGVFYFKDRVFHFIIHFISERFELLFLSFWFWAADAVAAVDPPSLSAGC